MNSRFVAVCSLVTIGSALFSKKLCDATSDECAGDQFQKCTTNGDGDGVKYCKCEDSQCADDWQQKDLNDCLCVDKPCAEVCDANETLNAMYE